MAGVATGFGPPSWSPVKYEHSYPYNVTAARALLAKAGYPNGKGIPTLAIYAPTTPNGLATVPVAEAVAQELKQGLNINTKINPTANTLWGQITWGGLNQGIEPGFNIATGVVNWIDPVNLTMQANQLVGNAGTMGPPAYRTAVSAWYFDKYDPQSVARYGNPDNTKLGTTWSDMLKLQNAVIADNRYLTAWWARQPALYRDLNKPLPGASTMDLWNNLVKGWKAAKTSADKHTAWVTAWKFGGNYSTYQNNTIFDFFVNGNFFFDGPAASGGIGSGNDLADFLFGLPDEFLQFGEAPSDIRTRSVYGFAQDEWRWRKNLTLTLGLRWEYNQPKYDTRGRSFSIIPGQHSQRFPNAPVGLLFPGDTGAPKGSNFSDFNDWAPRVGFAWDPLGKGTTSVRGGFGVFYDVLKGEDNLQFNGQAPFFGFADIFFDPSGPDIFTHPFQNAGQPNSFPSRPPASNIDFDAAGFLPFGGGGVFFVDPHLRTPYNYQYNLSVQHEIVRNLIGEASYVGSTSHKLTALIDRNPFILGTRHRVLNTTPGNDDGSFSFLDELRNVGTAS